MQWCSSMTHFMHVYKKIKYVVQCIKYIFDTMYQICKNKTSGIRSENLKTNDVNTKLKNIQFSILTETRQHLKPERSKKKDWITENILDLMEERRRYKNVNEVKYK